MGNNAGSGFFTDGNNQTGEWKPKKDFSGPAASGRESCGRCTPALDDEKYRHWAKLWTSALVGKESEQNHDTGFLYFYSSVPGFQLTRDPKLRDSALRGADHLVDLFNPVTQLIPAWSANGDDTIVDSMMNLQLLWWASHETGNSKYRDVGLKHALRVADWFVRR